MANTPTPAPESTAARVALWRALHVEVDPAPHVLDDTIGLKLLQPDEKWRQRPDMNPQFTRLFRASIVARARFIEDLVIEQSTRGVRQYILLGAGLDTFAQRKLHIASRLTLFEVDQPAPQEWKRQRLIELGFGVPDWLKLVPVDFEASESWMEKVKAAGFHAAQPAVVTSTGVSMYLSSKAVTAMLQQIAALAPGSTFVMSFILPIEMAEPEERPGYEASIKGARASGTPFLSFFRPEEMLTLAKGAGFKNCRVVSPADLKQLYFAQRTDGLHPGSEALLVATV